MTNYENQKERIDAILNSNNSIAIDIDTNEITTCRSLACSRCLFCGDYNECYKNTIKWLLAEYKEPEVDWSKVPIDTPVLVSEDGEHWYHRYFAGTNADNKALVYANGMTRWAAKTAISGPEQWLYIKLAELSDSPETEE